MIGSIVSLTVPISDWVHLSSNRMNWVVPVPIQNDKSTGQQ